MRILLLCCVLATCGAIPAQQVLRSLSYWDFAANYTPMGDRDHDGYEDVLTISHIYVGPYWTSIDYEVRLYSGRDGSLLRRGTRWAYPDQARVFPTGDHDGDGVRDYVCYDTDFSLPVQRVSVRSGADDHVFWMQQQPLNRNWAHHVIGDLDIDGDGLLDVVVGHPVGTSSRGEIWAYDHWGNLLYHLVGTPWVNSLAQSLARLGDVDGDGCDDYVAGLGDPNWYGAVGVISGRTGQFVRVVTGQNLGDYIGSGCVGCGDLDGDGLPDFAAGGGLSGSNGSVQAFSSRTGARLFACYSGYRGDRFGHVLRAADYDQDGIDDIISAAWNGVRVVSGREGTVISHYVPNSTSSLGTFEAQPLRTPSGFPHLVVSSQVLGVFLMSAAPHATKWLGHGCAAGSSGRPGRLGMRELQGPGRRLLLGDTEPGTGALLLLGLAQNSLGPVRLNAVGLPQCAVHPAVLDAAFFVTDATGHAYHDFPIRDTATFGAGIDAQWLTFDAAGGFAGLTDAWRLAIRP